VVHPAVLLPLALQAEVALVALQAK
jgi:hypothetical protein